MKESNERDIRVTSINEILHAHRGFTINIIIKEEVASFASAVLLFTLIVLSWNVHAAKNKSTPGTGNRNNQSRQEYVNEADRPIWPLLTLYNKKVRKTLV